jgi:hypothetical protein
VVPTEVGNKYNINGELQPTLIFEEGVTYRFDQSDTTNRGHPLRLSATEDGIHNGGSEYRVDTNVVGVAGEEGSFTQITVVQGSSDLFYYCVFHRGMGGQLNATESSSNNSNDAPSIEVGDDTFSGITFTGGSGDDQFTGGSGNDTINGGLGTDVVVFSGEVATYSITEVGNTVVVTDSQLNRDGTDTLNSIETFQFSDGTFQLSELLDVTDIDRGIYRFFNVDTGTHFLSGSTVERDSVINNLDAFNFEGPTFRAADPTNPAADAVFRFFNTQTGTHFFTQSTVERDNILETLPQFSFENEAYKGYTEQVDGSIPLYRFFNTQTGTHFYTAAEAEKNSIIENLPSFNFEGTAYRVDPVMG